MKSYLQKKARARNLRYIISNCWYKKKNKNNKTVHNKLLCFSGIVKKSNKLSIYRKNLYLLYKGIFIYYKKRPTTFFYGNPRKLRVFQIFLTILIGIEIVEALKDSTSGCCCFLLMLVVYIFFFFHLTLLFF